MTNDETRKVRVLGFIRDSGFVIRASSMHALVIALGSHGDVHPMLGIATALRGRGHRVTFVASPYFQPLARRAGFDDFIPLGTAEEFASALGNPNLWHPTKGFKAVFELGVLPATRPTYEAI